MVKQNDIRIGSRENPVISLDNSDIITVNGNLSCDLLCEEIPIDTLEIQCRYDRMHRRFAPSDSDGLKTADGLILYSREDGAGNRLDIPYATGLWYFNDGKYIGKFYVSDAKRTGRTVYTITAQSAMGVLDGMTYYGKLFLNQPLPDVLNDIILTDGLRATNTPFLTALAESIALSDGLDAMKVSGWIPVCTKREALHHVLFAQGLNIFKAENDAFLISRVSASVVGSIDANETYDSGSVELTERVKLVEVTEHSFVPNLNAEDTVLYDNTEGAVDMEAVVYFDSAPIVVSTIKATGTIKVKQKNENCAIITGIGTLSGKPYSHTSHMISRTSSGVPDGETITVSDATPVNSLNSNAVADRLYAYYTKRRQMQLPIVMNGEHCGMKYDFVSPYGDADAAYIAAMTINASAIAKADCRMIAGYVPPKGSGEFSHVVLLTGNGTFQVPEEVLNSDNPRIRFVLIGAGDCGFSGENGEDGPDGIVSDISKLAKPGKPGKNGSPGKILAVQFDGSNVLPTYRYNCGEECGYGHGNPTSIWNPETYSTIASSANGAVINSGYLDVLSGNIYGGPSPDYSGVMGGRGGGFVNPSSMDNVLPHPFAVYVPPDGGYYVVNKKIHEITGAPIGSVQYADPSQIGGDAHGAEYDFDAPMYSFPSYFDGAPGGGPVTPTDSNPTSCNGKPTVFYDSVMQLQLGNGGRGAHGADAPKPMDINPNAYGQGGIGGMGGAGGSSGGLLNDFYDEWDDYYVYDGYRGAGGKGGRGSDGAPGCILVYY